MLSKRLAVILVHSVEQNTAAAIGEGVAGAFHISNHRRLL